MKFIAYRRVSTKNQGIDGYGMEAQQQAIERYVTAQNGELIGGFEEVESGANNDRPQLRAAMQLAKAKRAVLVIAKLDRISRNASFLMQLQDSGVDFVATDMPNADKFTVSILACVAQRERELTSQRTRAGLAIAKARGVVLGNPRATEALTSANKAIQERKQAFAESAVKSIREIQSTGVMSLRRVAHCLNLRGEKTPRGGTWDSTTVRRVLACVK
jgi:DNA invertase Pin-like site-specific DNA recombinase